MNRLHALVSYLTWFLGMALVLWVGYLEIFPLRIVTFDRPGYIEVEKKVYRPGDILPVKYPFTKHINDFPEIHRRLINSTIYQLPPMTGSSRAGRHDSWYYMTVIPKSLPAGKYRLSIDFVYRLNFLRTYTVSLMSDPFEIYDDFEDKAIDKKAKN